MNRIHHQQYQNTFCELTSFKVSALWMNHFLNIIRYNVKSHRTYNCYLLIFKTCMIDPLFRVFIDKIQENLFFNILYYYIIQLLNHRE